MVSLAPPADLWERIRRGYAMPDLDSDLVRDRDIMESAHQEARRLVDEGGLTEDHVHDAVRIAATIRAAAVALELGG